MVHHVETVGVQTGHAEELRDTLDEHGDDGDGDAADFLLEGPAVDEDTAGDDEDDVHEGGLEAVFGDTHAAALGDAFLHAVVDPAAADETACEETGSGDEVEEAGLDGAVEVEAGVEDVADGGEEGVLVPDEGTGGETHAEDVGVPEEHDDHADGGDAVHDHLGLLGEGVALEFAARLVGDRFREEADDQQGGESVHGAQQPEDNSPLAESNDDTLERFVSQLETVDSMR